jgi:hypothetical protein
VLKQRQDFIVGRLGTIVVNPSSPNSIEANFPSPTLRPIIPPSSSIRPFEKPNIKQKMLQLQSKNFATTASHFQVNSKIYDALLVAKMDINHERKNKVKISNMKITRQLGVISKEEFRAH